MLIGISGFIGSGKDTAADYLVNKYGYKRTSFAGSLKDAISAVFNWDRKMLDGITQEDRDKRNMVDPWWSKRLDMPKLTPRWVLQYWGTEVCRRGFHDDMWIASLEHKLFHNQDDVVITDCRFPNELKAIKSSNGTTIRINRGPHPDWYHYAEDYNKGPRHIGWSIAKTQLDKLGVHASEYSGVGLKYDYVIDNDGTIDELHQAIDTILNY